MSQSPSLDVLAGPKGDAPVTPPVSMEDIQAVMDGDTERRNDLHVGPPRELPEEEQARIAAQLQKKKQREEREAEKAQIAFEENERARKNAMIYSHKDMIKKYKKFYKVPDMKAPLNPSTVNKAFVDIFDDLLVVNRIMRDDKRGRWADAWEFGVGVVFGIMILIGSIFIAMDATKENPIECETSYNSGTKVYSTTCEEASNKIGTAGMLVTGSWIVVAGGFGFILVTLWRIVVKIRLAKKHHATLLTFFHDFATDGSNSKVEEVNELGAMKMFNDESREESRDSSRSVSRDASMVLDGDASPKAVPVNSRFYRNVPSFYAPRSAYHRVARGYGSPLMC